MCARLMLHRSHGSDRTPTAKFDNVQKLNLFQPNSHEGFDFLLRESIAASVQPPDIFAQYAASAARQGSIAEIFFHCEPIEE